MSYQFIHSAFKNLSTGIKRRDKAEIKRGDKSSPICDQEIPLENQIYCNRSLNMKNIDAIGFNLDYTLAQYMPEAFESLAYECTIKKLIDGLKYQLELEEWKYDRGYMVRGLVLDKKRGNILKMDRHKYVKVAHHGFKVLSKEEKVAAYGNTLTRDSFDEPDYALIDTLFSLCEAYLFAQLVDFRDKHPEKFSPDIDYAHIHRDVRAAVDLCHRDGTLKTVVAKNPERYITKDSAIVSMLEMLRDTKRSTFMVTTSSWDYTNVVMNFLCGVHNPNEKPLYKCDWLKYFNVVITESCKPSFFHGNNASLFEVDPETGLLHNTHHGARISMIGCSPTSIKERACKVFQGGNVEHLHELLSIKSSSQVLYVGGHIYSDFLQSNKPLGWRTMIVVPELKKELEILLETRDTLKKLQKSRREHDNFLDKLHNCIWSCNFLKIGAAEVRECYSHLKKLESKRDEDRLSLREFHQKFHKVWGSLMKTGYQNSRFAHQVEGFACLYACKVSNLLYYFPNKHFSPSEDYMPHEFNTLLPL